MKNSSLKLEFVYFKTSYVTVNLGNCKGDPVTFTYFKTSYVTVNQNKIK